MLLYIQQKNNILTKGNNHMINVQNFLMTHTLEDLNAEYGIEYKIYEEHNLVNLNYSQIESPKTHPIVRECRGLILTLNDFSVVSRKFDRFFNYGEAIDLMKNFDSSHAVIGDKEDGTNIGIYWNNHTSIWNISTRGMALAEGDFFLGGSFAENISKSVFNITLKEFQNNFCGDKNYTYIFEFVSPENQIVTPYEKSELVLLGIRENSTGKYLDISNMKKFIAACIYENVRMVHFAKFTDFENIKDVANNLEDLKEGFVVWDTMNDIRCKIKSQTYLIAHRLRGNTVPTYKNMMELVLEGEVDEFLAYFKNFEKYIEKPKYDMENFEKELVSVWENTKNIKEQKDFALSIKNFKFSGILFAARASNKEPLEVFHSMPIEKKLKLFI